MTKPAMKEPERSLRFMQDPMKWPYMWLPLKRRRADGAFPDLAIMLGDGPIIYHVNPYKMGELEPAEQKKALDVGREEFPDYEGIVDAGWRVD